MNIEKWNEADGTLSEGVLRRKLEAQGYSVNRYVYRPGTYFPEHTHYIDKIDAVLSGRLRIVVEDREVILEAGDWISVPRGTAHSAEVVGKEPVVSLDATKTEQA